MPEWKLLHIGESALNTVFPAEPTFTDEDGRGGKGKERKRGEKKWRQEH